MINKKRRKHNKKKQSDGWAFPTPLALTLVLAAVVSLSYLWLHGRCEALGVRIQELEREDENIRHRLLNEEYKWSNMKSLPNIKAALRRHGIVMAWPNEGHVVRVVKPVSPEKEAWSQQYAQHTGVTMNE